MSDTIITNKPVSKDTLETLAKQRFGDMVKGVIDIETKDLAIGGELHADQEALLIKNGNKQDNLWGINIYIDDAFPENIEFDSVINIRPNQNNPSRDVLDQAIQEKILCILEQLLQ